MKNIEHKLDCLVQEWASKKRSEVSGRLGCVAHHIYGRANKFLRYDEDNLFVCTPIEHRMIHDGNINVDDFLSEERLERLRLKYIESLKWKPDADFYEKKLKEWG